jgi:glycosyltransferase involved in cell wall biosynthesis
MFQRSGHVPFNAGFLAIIRAAFPKEELSFYGGAAHIEELKKQLGQPLAGSVAWLEIQPVPPGLRYGNRFFRELRIIRRLFRILSQDSGSRLVLLSAFPSTILALKAARCLQWINPPVQIVLHRMSGVVGKRYRHPIHRFQDMRTALTLLGNKNIQYIVLEQPVRDTVVKHLPLLSSHVEVLDHPIPPNEGASETIELSVPIRFGFLGLVSKAKGFPLFLRLADELITKNGRSAEFHVIGHFLEDGTGANDLKALATKPGDTQMSRADFTQRLSRLHFVVLPYEVGFYTLTASGVLLDAIAWEKPVIARKIPIFQSMFEKYGDIGHLFKDDTELLEVVEEILKGPDRSRYRTQVLNLRNARKARTPEMLAAVYRQMSTRLRTLA